MKIIIDSREQCPLKFTHPWFDNQEIKKLEVGDYCVEYKDGHIAPYVFERKSLSDLFGTMGQGYDRFKREMNLALELQTTIFIIIEGTLTDVGRGVMRSQLKGSSIQKKLFTLWVKHGIQSIFCQNRFEMEDYITHFYIAYGKEYFRKSGKK
jgi:ERCC4-type nuclease